MAKIFLIDINKGPQTAYAIFSAQKNHGDREILEAQEMIEQQGSRELSVADLASRVAMSNRNFIRRFKAQRATRPSSTSSASASRRPSTPWSPAANAVDTVANRIGYEDVGSFRAIFKRVTGRLTDGVQEALPLLPRVGFRGLATGTGEDRIQLRQASSASSVISVAWTASSSCSTVRGPTMGAVTAGLCRSHASPTTAGFSPIFRQSFS